jgi:anaerobic magnesium-protoporphyrin IX monomethyl ester cyclase
MARVLFINPSTRHHGTALTVYPPLGILSICAILRKAGHEVRFIDADIDEIRPEYIQQTIKTFAPQVVGITMSTLQFRSTIETAEMIKRVAEGTVIVVGGPHPSALKDDILKSCSSIDVVVYGEGEITTVELVRAIEDERSLKGIKGLCFRKGMNVIVNPPREPIEDLDSLPKPALDLAMPIRQYPGSYPVGARPTIQFMASRGCPFHCTFCSNAVWGRRLRLRSPESILEEIEGLWKDYRIREVFFQDDTFNMKRDWFEAICSGLIERGLNNKMVFRAPFRANEMLVDRDMLKLAKQAGFWMIFYGVESGSQQILDSVKKNLKKEEIERAFKLTKKAGIKTYASFMIGNLGEDRKTVGETIDFALKLNPDFYGFAIATPYPGSQLYEIAQKDGLIRSSFDGYGLSRYVMDGGGLSSHDVEELVQDACRLMECRRSSWYYKLWERMHGGHMPPKKHLDYYPVKEPDLELLETEILMGESDWDVLGDGWYALENAPPRFRWTEQRATAFLKGGRGLQKLCLRALTKPDGLALKISVNHNAIGKFKIGTEWDVLKVQLDGIDEFALRIDLEAERSWIPNELLGNGDLRELGVAVEKIWLES